MKKMHTISLTFLKDKKVVCGWWSIHRAILIENEYNLYNYKDYIGSISKEMFDSKRVVVKSENDYGTHISYVIDL
ncbi:hypothetical protein [Sedimentibacter sp.]|uniref:hypothetical protein n=1 Tax=Sedimentibacter sp. TaxID=1960295 RepID=UPI00289BE7CB|nr:hypothetical protein [Sedimentibacter sp.]